MKIRIQFLILPLLGFFSCEKHSMSPKENMVNTITASSWVTESVMNEPDGDVTFEYSNFSIAFEKKASGNYEGNYYISNGKYAFTDASGQWTLSDDLKTLTFSNGQIISIDYLDQRLKMDFMVADQSGRFSGLSGHFIFILKRA